MTIRRINMIAAALTLLFGVSLAQNAAAAFCSLRDPATAMQQFFPESTGYRSVVKTIQQSTRSTLRHDLTIDMHFNEFGRHTVYFAFQNNKPIAMIHSRSESSRWGLIEFSWAMNANFEIEDIYFQRCRARLCNDATRQTIRDTLKGKNKTDLKDPALKQQLRQALNTFTNSPRTIEFTDVVLNSALKTLAITELEWETDLENLFSEYFSSLSKSLLNGSSSSEVEKITLQTSLPTELLDLGYLDASSFQLFNITQANEKLRMASIQSYMDSRESTLLFVFNPDGKLLHFETLSGMLEPSFQQALEDIQKKTPPETEQCANLAELTVRAMYLAAYPEQAEQIP